jgi:hypothetical protein
LRREGRMFSAEPVCSCALFALRKLAHETAGAARTRLSLRPLLEGRTVPSFFGRAGRFWQSSDASRRENAGSHPAVIVRPCAQSRTGTGRSSIPRRR